MEKKRVQVATYQEKMKGQTVCGDSHFYLETEDYFICAISDGLGSGQFAKESSEIVINIIKNNLNASENELIALCNKQLTGKRGVVLGVLKLDFNRHTYTFSSIGNIGFMVITNNYQKKRNIPDRGYLGGYKRVFKVMEDTLNPNVSFIMFSDGISEVELSKSLFLNKDVNNLVEDFGYDQKDTRDDDTTLIAIRYSE